MRGRGDLLLELRLLLRPQALVGLVAALAGLLALIAVYLPWYEVTMQVAYMPWEASSRPPLPATHAASQASLAGWQAHPWTWIAAALAVAATAVSVLAALDRPPRRHDDLALLAGFGLAVLAGLGALTFPPVERFGGSRLQELSDLAGRLPTDLELSFAVGPAVGVWVLLVAAALLVASGFASRHL